MGPVTAWAGRVEIMPSLPAFGYSTKLCTLAPDPDLLLLIFIAPLLAVSADDDGSQRVDSGGRSKSRVLQPL